MAEVVARQPVAAPPWDALPDVEEAPGSVRPYLRIFGKFLISVGVGVLLFVAWTLWGTGLYTAGQQERLGQELDRRIATAEVPRDRGGGRVGPPRRFAPGPGEPVFRMKIPEIGLSAVVVEGVGTADLRKGPGHYPSCRAGFERPFCTNFEEAWPGQRGRVVLSGHRTTYGAEFHRVDELDPGDEITIESEWGTFVYRVTGQEIVQPDSRKVVVPGEAAELALTTCNPKYSAAERLIVHAELEKT